MKAVDLPFFVGLGAALEVASTVEVGSPLFDSYLKLYQLRRLLETLLTGEHGRLAATTHDLLQLRGAIDGFERRHFRDDKGDWRSPPEDERADFELTQLVGLVNQFRTVLLADLRTSTAFSVLGAGIFDVNLLVNCAHQAIGEDARKLLSPDALAEIDASGKCLAFNLPTASGFHAMRAVERVIKSYLTLFFSAEEINRWKNWGQYLAALERISARDERPRPSQEAIALIRQIKDIYRNPVIHPERVLSSEEATTLFHSTLAAIHRLAIELAGGQQKLPGLFGGLFGAAGAVAALGSNAKAA